MSLTDFTLLSRFVMADLKFELANKKKKKQQGK